MCDMSQSSRGISRGVLAGAIALAMFASSGLAQNYNRNQNQQANDGRILERDLRVGGGGLSPRANMADEVRLRNALITGNVGSSRAFRGNVGYTAPSEFRGSLGSDDTFRFRRDTLSAGQVRGSLRGVDALRYQYSFTTGNNQARDGVLTEIGRLGSTGIAAAKSSPGTTDLGKPGGGTYEPRSGFLRSTAAFTASRGLTPSVVGYELDKATNQYRTVTASSLLGVKSFSREDLLKGPTPVPPAITNRFARDEDLTKPRPGLQESVVKPVGEPSQINELNRLNTRGSEAEEGSGGTGATVYDNLRERLAKASEKRGIGKGAEKALDQQDSGTSGEEPKPGEGVVQEPKSATLQERLAKLRDSLLPENVREGAKKDRFARIEDPRKKKQRAADGSQSTSGIDPVETAGIDEDLVNVIRDAGGKTRQYIDATAGGTRDVFSENMIKGQELLSQRKYFDAEVRFSNALMTRPGDISAMSGRLHSQLGAGLYLSAAINLRQLLSQAPEVASVRYEGDAIPSRERLTSIAAELRANIRRSVDLNEVPSGDEGLLLAYLGWQSGDRAMTEEGLKVAKTASDALVREGQRADAMAMFLTKVWLEEGSAPAEAESGEAEAPVGTPEAKP